MQHQLTIRNVALVAAAATVFAGAPFLGVASAAVSVSVSDLTTTGAVIGPNSGFLGLSPGIQGRVPFFRIDVGESTATVQGVTVRVAGANLAVNRDFDASDGFALFKQIAGADDTFSQAEFDAGPVSSGWLAGPTGTQGFTPVALTFGTQPTGVTSYMLAVHAASGVITDNRTFTAAIARDDIDLSGAVEGPSSALSSKSQTIDSVAPFAPTATNFTRDPHNAGIEDAYIAGLAEGGADRKLVFLNSATDTAQSNVLVRPPGAPVPYAYGDANGAVTTTIQIGDGTGITATNLIARNNQTSNNVYVRAFDRAGNLTASAALTDSQNDDVPRTNDVTAPVFTTLTASPSGINAGNQTQVNVRVTSTGAAPPPGFSNDYKGARAELVLLDGTGNPTAIVSKRGEIASTGANADVKVDSTKRPDESPLVAPEGSQFKARGFLIDALKNETDPTALSGAVIKDISAPTMTRVSPAGEFTFRVEFSEPMSAGSICETSVGVPPTPPACGPSPFGLPQNARVQDRLLLTAGTGGGSPSWGSTQPGWSWSPDFASGIITLGDQTSGDDPVPGNVVTPVTPTDAQPGLSDRVGNSIVLTPRPIESTLVPIEAVTGDVVAGANGYLDTVEVTMSGAFAAPLALDLAKFQVIGSTGPVTPYTITGNVGSEDVPANTVLAIRFESAFGTGEKPTVKYLGGGNLLAAISNVPVLPFQIGAIDAAPPQVIATATKDIDGNAQIDQIVVTFSEPIDHAIEDNTGWFETDGYEDQGDCNAFCWNSKSPASGFSNQSIVNLAEKDVPDTGVQPHLRFVPTLPGFELTDSEGNFTSDVLIPFVGDGAQPVIVGRKTADNDTDGYLDAVDLVFSESIANASFPNGQFQVENRQVIGTTPIDVKTIRVRVTESTTPDTAAKLKIKYTGGLNGGLTDTASPTPNPARTDAALVEAVDGAGPAITKAAHNFSGVVDTPGNGTEMLVTFSEPIAGFEAEEDLLVTQGATERTISGAEAADEPANSYTLTIDPALDPYANATVEIQGEGLITDVTAAGENPNTQTGPVLSPGYPSAILTLGCPATGVCTKTSRTFATGAAGNANVSGWALRVVGCTINAQGATTCPTPAVPTLSQFSATKPVNVTPSMVPTDKTYKAFLWTRDSAGNISHSSGTPKKLAERQFTVDATSPTISVPVVQNFAGQAVILVRDNDPLIRVRVTAFGADAATWSRSGSTIDYRSLSGKPTDGAVQPASTGWTPIRQNGKTTGYKIDFPFINRVSGTTKYPVGTVLREAGKVGPLWYIDDGVGTQKGRVVRRPMLSKQVLRSMQISENLIIEVPAPVLAPMSIGPIKVYRDGRLVRAISGGPTYVMSEGKKRGFSSAAIFSGMGYKASNVMLVPGTELAKVTTSSAVTPGVHPSGTYLFDSSTGRYSVLVRKSDGTMKRRLVGTTFALTTLVSPAEVLKVPAGHPSLLVALEAFVRGVRDGMLTRDINTHAIYTISRGLRRHISGTVFGRMGYYSGNAVNRSGIRDYSRPYSGMVEGRNLSLYNVLYKITVRDKAGNATVRGATVFGLGTPDPAPPVADPARP